MQVLQKLSCNNQALVESDRECPVLTKTTDNSNELEESERVVVVADQKPSLQLPQVSDGKIEFAQMRLLNRKVVSGRNGSHGVDVLHGSAIVMVHDHVRASANSHRAMVRRSNETFAMVLVIQQQKLWR